MAIIKTLPKDLVEKIAAGEVVERPASVVKELLENALDAKATHIIIDLESAGTNLIKVSDNGGGMDDADLLLCVKAHATSKISTADDLFSIHTLGFRGEALASMCAVSKVQVTTRQVSAIAASSIQVNGGLAEKIQKIGAPVGTTVSVTELFYNVPARKKFLKSNSNELQAITTLVSNYCMANPSVHITLSNDGKKIIDSPASAQNNLLDKISHIYGAQISKQMLPIQITEAGVSITGYISNPSLSRSDKKAFTFFMNGRFIKNPALLTAIIEGYETLLMVGRYPVGVINLQIDPHTVDVNVHPSKDIVKFDDESTILNLLRRAVKQTLDSTHLLREHVENQKQEKLVTPTTNNNYSSIKVSPEQAAEFVKKTYAPIQDPLITPGLPSQNQQFQNSINETTAKYQNEISSSVATTIVDERQQSFTNTPNVIRVDEHLTLRYLGLLHRTYAVCESKDGLVLIDFHAAHERYLYEQIKIHRMDKAKRTQALLSPLKIEFTPAQLLVVKDNLELLESLGFLVEEFGGSTVLVRSVPLLFHKQMNKQVLIDIVEQLSEGSSKKMDETLDKIMIRMSCRAADKAGDELSDEKVKEIIRQVSTAGHKYSCPHGRPIFLSVNKAELEKMFKRRV